MKHLSYLLLLLGGIAIALSSCEKDLPTYNYSENRLNFSTTDTLQTYSFIYSNGAQIDTVWYTVSTLGFVANEDRPIELEQIKTGDNDAVAGTHFVSFDDEGLKKFYYIPANAIEAKIPVVVKRDASLATQDVNLSITFKTNNYFSAGYKRTSKVKLIISNRMSKPTAWQGLCNYYFSSYGSVKHQFMIDVTGFKWDDNFLKNELYVLDYSQCDQGYMAYLANFFHAKLAELNTQREAQGLGKLKEADGTLVAFSYGD